MTAQADQRGFGIFQFAMPLVYSNAHCLLVLPEIPSQAYTWLKDPVVFVDRYRYDCDKKKNIYHRK